MDEDSKDDTLGWFTENGYIVLKTGIYLEMKSGHLKTPQLEFYRQNGYCLVENVINKEDCRLLIAGS